ncbi:uncharacterized protein LOC131640795 [Vicia villosa]|uniref:uncharacterized protein LOC131640795 n=1 Tax=Vicia villosa TaxID=3911 RepID=UPI00273BFDC0|nr:uncharacterized protein LOC131640795 [Vicia villosa]
MELIQGAERDQFTQLRSYAQELLNSNPNSNVILQCIDSTNGHVFVRIYVCLRACKVAFAKFCKPLICLDACFLKGDYGGQLMAVVESDGNNQIFLIAYGLVPAVQGISEHVEQRLCVEHLYGNRKKKFSGLVLKEVFRSAPRATTIQERVWSRSHFKTHVKCDLQVNNWCEAFNRAIPEHRDKPIISLLEGIKHYITKTITSQKEMMQKYNGDICPNIQLILEKNKKHSHGWIPTWHGDDDMEIFGVNNGRDTFCINLKEGTCSCRKWMLNGIPCNHVISYMWKSKYLECYGNIVYPTNGPQLWPVMDGQMAVNPPLMRRAIGRP